MRPRLILAIALLALPLAASQAAAQGGATMTITVTGPPTATVNAGLAHSASFTVNVEASGFQCTQPGTIELAVALSNAGGAPAGVVPTVEPANLSLTVPPGPHGSPVPLPVPLAPPFNASAGSVTLRVTTAPTSSGVYPATVSVAYAGGPAGAGCIGDLPAATGTANHQLTIVAQQSGNNTSPPGTTPPGPGGNNTGNNTTPPPPANRGLPGFEPLVLAGAAAIVAVAARRRGQA